MLKVIPKAKLAAVAKKKKITVAKSWGKEKIAEKLSLDELRKLYAAFKPKPVKKVVKKKVVKKKPVKKKVVKKKVTKRKPVKKRPVKRKVVKKKTLKRKIKKRR
ncbi:MAG: hypothetical protein KAU95_00095 [Candidatus Aenigmarchaeota archaeon]|nr:hypothetical protein [Candidatus Aenigmarchaeota archaeon]